METVQTYKNSSFTASFISGGVAGFLADLAMFPLDTLKTRLQSAAGLGASGGHRSLYAGASTILLGSAPSAALFFAAYDATKSMCDGIYPGVGEKPLVHIGSSLFAEIIACSLWVPAEVMKQRMQAKQYQSGLLRGIHQLYRTEGISGFYRGFKATIFREIPFVCIQFPLYERMLLMASKSNFNQSTEENQLKNWKTAGLCGAISSAITAALTTPLDVIKTRTMLLDLNKGEAANIDVRSAIRVLWLEGGLPRLFSGVVPRTLSIGAGGFIFFGAYQKTKNLLHPSFYFN